MKIINKDMKLYFSTYILFKTAPLRLCAYLFRIKLISAILLTATLTLPAQTEMDVFSIPENERVLLDNFNKLYSEISDAEKDSLNSLIIDIFKSSLSLTESFFYPWPELDMIGKIRSDDMLVNIFTWHILKKDNTYIYYGIIQYRLPSKRKEDKITVYLLTDKSSLIKQPEKEELTPDNWYGALYYSLSTHTHRRKTWYVLLGFDFNNNFSNKKIIEILHFEKDKPLFGEDIKTESGPVRRIIFEYSSNVVMALRFDDKLNQTVFDHLSPLEPIFKGFYRFYVPDGSYDALRFYRGNFTLERDVDARNY